MVHRSVAVKIECLHSCMPTPSRSEAVLVEFEPFFWSNFSIELSGPSCVSPKVGFQQLLPHHLLHRDNDLSPACIALMGTWFLIACIHAPRAPLAPWISLCECIVDRRPLEAILWHSLPRVVQMSSNSTTFHSAAGIPNPLRLQRVNHQKNLPYSLICLGLMVSLVVLGH
jgi:hypothetical protein